MRSLCAGRDPGVDRRRCAPPRRSRRRPARRARRRSAPSRRASTMPEVGRDARRRARMVAGDHDHADAGALRLARSAAAASARGGSMMPTVPTKIRSCSSAPSSPLPGRRLRPAAGRPRPACAAPRRTARRRRPATRARGASSSGTTAMPTRTRVQRCSSTSGAPLVMTTSASPCSWSRSTRRHHLALGGERDLARRARSGAARRSLTPELALGHQERGLGRIALDLPRAVVVLAQVGVAGQAAAAAARRCCSARSGPAVSRPPVVLERALRRIADAGDAAARRRR